MTNYRGKLLFITGGASGMGLVAACELFAMGAHVVIFNRDKLAAVQAVQTIESKRSHSSQTVACYPLDVAERAQVLEGFAAAVRECGTPQVVIHMAGIGGVGPLETMPFETFDRIIKINVYGTRNVADAAIQAMRKNGGGALVLAGSLGGFVPVPGYTAYGASKFAVVGFAQCLRSEVKAQGIRVLCFCPGEVDTPGLAAERAHPHPAAMAIKAIGGTIAPQAAVRALLKGIERRQFLVIPGWRTKLIFWLVRITPIPVWNFFTDAIVALDSMR
jgi:3-dehydrosphinganine reductase